jgi:hypothetical protein
MRFGRINDRLSDDALEAWAHCAWGANAALAAANADPACKTLVRFLAPLVDSIEKLLMLSPEEKATPSFAGTLERLDERFGRRLRIGPVKLACMADPAIRAAATARAGDGHGSPDPLQSRFPDSAFRPPRTPFRSRPLR